VTWIWFFNLKSKFFESEALQRLCAEFKMNLIYIIIFCNRE